MDAQIGRTTIRLLKGDICDCAAEAIVNAANNHLWMGAGVAGAIKRSGGEEIEREAVSKGPIPIGEAAVTGAGRLAAKYVIHAAAMGQDLATDANKVRLATKNSLLRAEGLKVESIAFPALGTGVGGFPKEEAAEVMIDAVAQHIGAGSRLKEVLFALFDEESLTAFEEALARRKEDKT
ncbi:MAG: hypothetical protein GTO55_00995 [Armatimonadetes bacterium]|nr:hypothetical protein [Armatimonadota bacterium]NIM22860.1 hypothetical protein [Armatimonadota bacterium]NIM66726.1 hypothetical protein [Armatimonadota bacterium]NIM75283.1 hypothetical protein [Armatimonadota bacterium]NIN04923.1 hypothetical protein [Armatimonadota bacterium]